MEEYETRRINNVGAMKDAHEASVTLVLYHAAGSTTEVLREGASVEIGRMPPCQLVIPDESLSRRHARVRLVQGQLFVADLESTNGTMVGERHVVEETPVSDSDIVTLGSVAMRFSKAGAEDESALESYDQFRQHVDDEIVRAKHFRGAASVLALRLEGGGHIVTLAHERLAALLSPVDRIALYSPDVLLVLVPEPTADRAHALMDAIAKLPQRPRLLAGCASYPASAATADELIDQARGLLRRATADAPSQRAVRGARSLEKDEQAPGRIVASPAMVSLYEQVARLRKAPSAVVLHGETGTGKEVVARSIHEGGPRANKPLVTVNCAAIPANLVESTLFGHEPGAFTGADKLHIGIFESAQGGTVFLDEIGELPLEHQAKLLRALETKTVQRVGSTREIPVDARVVAASHRDLEEMVQKGTFREDLYFRLNVFMLRIPPLRERREEIVPLAERFLAEAARQAERPVPAIAAETRDILVAYNWPGNVRELKNAMERAAVIGEDVVCAEDLPEKVRRFAGGAAPTRDAVAAATTDGALDLKTMVRRYEAKLIEQALAATSGNQTTAADRLKTPLRTLVHKIKEFRESGDLPPRAS